MKLPSTLLRTLAVAVTSIGVAGCVPVAGDVQTPAPATDPPAATPAATEPTPTDPRGNPDKCEPGNKPSDNVRPRRDPCPACGRG